jgi:transcriptional regulator NrdR family protein
MLCPNCQLDDSRCTDSRGGNGGLTRKRRHSCNRCQFRWSTREVSEGLWKEMLEIIGTHLAIEDAVNTTGGSARPLVGVLFGDGS